MFMVWLPNFRLISEILVSSNATVVEKIDFLFSLFGSIQTNFSVASASYAILIALLFGVNIALLSYYVHDKRVARAGSGAAVGVGGLISGIFGIGCAACGTVLLTPLLAVFGASGFLVLLPLGGEEFGFIGIGLLLYSSYILLHKVNEPLTCDVQ